MKAWFPRAIARWVGLLALVHCLGCGSDASRARDHLEQGQAYLQQARRTEATLEFQSALKFDPTSAEAHNRLADIDFLNGDYANALFHVSEAYRLKPDDAHAALHLASLLRADQPKRAAELVESVIEREPNNPAGYIGRSDQALSTGRTRDAVKAARKAMEVAPEDPNSDWQYGYVLQALIRERQVTGDPVEDKIYTEAINAFERYIRKGGTAPWNAQVEQARVMAAAPGLTREAAAQFRVAVEQTRDKGAPEDQQRAAAWSADFARSAGADELLEWSINHLVELNPHDYSAWRSLADLYARQRKSPEPVWNRFVDALPTEPRPHIEYARYLVFSWKLDEALAYLSTKASEGVDPPMLLGSLASTQIAAGRLRDATATVKRLEREHPGHPRTILERAQLDIRTGESPRAARSLRKLVEEHPSYNAYLLLAHVEQASANLKAALQATQKAIESATYFNPDAESLQAQLLAKTGNCPGSIRSLVSIREHMPLSPTENVLLAHCRYETGKEDHGRHILKELLASRRPPPQAVVDFARREGHDPESANLARRELETLLRRQPEHWDAVRELTRIDAAADRLPKALARLDRLVKAAPETVPPAIRLLRARVSADSGREAGTLEDAKSAFWRQPQLPGSLEMLVVLHLRQQQIAEAISAAEEARRVGAFSAKRRVLLGQLYRMRGRDSDALATFEQAAAVAPENPTFHYQVGLSLLALDRDEEASRAFEKALAISATFPEADDARRALEGS